MMAWVIWSEEHGAWWAPGEHGYTRSLRDAGLYNEKRAREIMANANNYCPPGKWNEWAMADPLERTL